MKYKDYEGTIEDLVCSQLEQIEHIHGVRVIYAIESGSRAWGFASPDSDYDVRFVYVRTTKEYLSLAPHEDHIEGILDGTLDINGWDVSKILQQIHRSNPNVYEWLNSPIVYRKNNMINKVRDVAKIYYSEKPFLYHYYGTAKKNYEQFLQQEYVKYKKYFYVLRPLLACSWIERKHCPPPVLFQTLLDELDDLLLKHDIDLLRKQKAQMVESETGPVVPSVHDYIEQQISYYTSKLATLSDDRHFDWVPIDDVFRNILKEMEQS